MYFAIKNGKVVSAHRDYSIIAACPHDSIAEKADSLLVNAAYPDKLKVVEGEVVDKTDAEIAADVEAARVASIKEVRKLHIVDTLAALGKFDAAMSALNADALRKARWDAATMIAVDDSDFLALISALGVTMTQILENYEA